MTLRTDRPPVRPRSGRRPLPPLIFLLVLAIAAVAVWWYVIRQDEQHVAAQRAACSTVSAAPPSLQPASITLRVYNATDKAGLATTVAQDFPDRRVLVVETDARRPVLADDFGLEPAPGLIECVISGEPLQTACRPTYLENLHIVPVGGSDSYVGRPLRSSRIAAVVDAMRQMYDMTILDLPPILADSDALLLSDLLEALIRLRTKLVETREHRRPPCAYTPDPGWAPTP